MLDFIFIIIAAALGGPGTETAATDGTRTVAAPVAAAATGVTGDLLAGTGNQVLQQYQAEPQVPSGKYTTAVEVKPIMNVTKGQWIAVREYDGQDIFYMTSILSWRCGLVGARYAINGGAMQDWPLSPCQVDTASPNALQEDAKIYEVYPLKSIESVEVEVIYDDLTTDRATYARKQVLLP